MTDPGQSPTPKRLRELPDDEATEAVRGWLQHLDAGDVATRKRTLRDAREIAEAEPGVFDGVTPTLTESLTDDDRAVRLTTAKLFVTLAETAPALVVPAVDALAAGLADDTEFYYVRARCAEALGYVALEHPEPVSDPDILADFRIGLSFDEPEVKEKLAKGLAYVALGDPSRLRHHVGSLADQLDDENDLVRYHLCTALVAVGCAAPERLADAEAVFRERLRDENPYVRGRAAEALGVLWRAAPPSEAVQELEMSTGDAPAFLMERLRFARAALDDEDWRPSSGVGTVDGLRESTEDAVEALTAPNGTDCPNCGLDLPDDGPPMCPRCGVPR